MTYYHPADAAAARSHIDTMEDHQMGIQSFSTVQESLVLFVYNHDLAGDMLDVAYPEDVKHIGTGQYFGRLRSIYVTPLAFYWQVLRFSKPALFAGEVDPILVTGESDSLGRRVCLHEGIAIGRLSSVPEDRAMECDFWVHDQARDLFFAIVPLDEPKSIGERQEREQNDLVASLKEENFRLRQQVVANQLTIEALKRQAHTQIDNRRKAYGLIDTMAEV